MSANGKDRLDRIQRAIVRHYNEEQSTQEGQDLPRDPARNETRDDDYSADMSRIRTMRGELERQAKKEERKEAVGRAFRGVADRVKDGKVGRAARWVKDAVKDKAPVSSSGGGGGGSDDTPGDKGKSKKEKTEDKQKSKKEKSEGKKQRKADDERWREDMRGLELKTYGLAAPPPLGMF